MAKTKTILGFIAGASIGAIAGILVAPDTGSATRKKIIDKSGDLKDAIKDGLLDKLEAGVGVEIKQDEARTVPKMDTGT